MNLVAKEYVAAKCDHPGVLILSEMAGAAVELTDAIQINLNDTEQIEHAIVRRLKCRRRSKGTFTTNASHFIRTNCQ